MRSPLRSPLRSPKKGGGDLVLPAMKGTLEQQQKAPGGGAPSGKKGASEAATKNKKKVIKKRSKPTFAFDHLPMKYKIYHMLDTEGIPNVEMSPFYQQIKNVIYRVLALVTFLMSLCIILWTLPQYVDQNNKGFEVIILMSVLTFTIEWCIRMACAPLLWKALLAPLNLIDIIGLLPFWINYADIVPRGLIHFVLLLRIFRLIRALLAFRQYEIVIKTIQESTEVAALMGIMFAVALPTVGCAMYYAERGTWSDERQRWERPCRLDDNCTLEVSPFQDAAEGIWFASNTLTTLGLGDVYPVSDIGYIVGGLTMIVAVFMIAFPIMILVVNFETEQDNVVREQLRQQAKMGRYLQELQQEHTKVESEEALVEAAFHRSMMAAVTDEEDPPSPFSPTGGFQSRTVNFRVNKNDVYRQAVLFGEEEVRYAPILALMRDPLDPNLLHLTQNASKPYQFRFRVALGTFEADQAAKRAMNAILPTTCMKVTSARHFHVLEVHFALLKPEVKCEFIKNVRLLRAYHDNVVPEQTTVTGTLELENMRCTMDEQRIRDLGYALQRCRLRITAAVVYHDPITYEVPIFLDMLRATSLIKELTARPKGLTYCTKDQLLDLINGIHHLINIRDPTTDEQLLITNAEEINAVVVQAIISGYSMLLPDANATKPEEFLFPMMRDAAIANQNDVANGSKKHIDYHGVFTNRLARRPEKRGWWNVVVGKEALFEPETQDVFSRDTKVLCHVNVKCVVPSYTTTTVSMQCSGSSPAIEKRRNYSVI